MLYEFLKAGGYTVTSLLLEYNSTFKVFLFLIKFEDYKLAE